MVAKATRASSAVAFLVSITIVSNAPAALARRAPHIIVEPVLSRLDDGRPTIRVSIANDSTRPIVVDPKTVEVFLARAATNPRKGRLAFFPMLRYPCPPPIVGNGAGPITITSSDGTTIVWSTPDSWPSPKPTPRETPMIVRPGTDGLSASYTFGGEDQCQDEVVGNPAKGFASAHVWAVYATVTWHEPGSAKRSRIVSVVKQVDVPTTSARPITSEGQP